MSDAFRCPITHAIMLDPVVNGAGITYERYAIAEWFQTHSTDPTTHTALESKVLIPNVALRSQIDDYVRTNGIPDDWRGYADTLRDTDSLIKLARMGLVTPASLTAARAAYNEKRWQWQRTINSFQRAERRARGLETQVAQLWTRMRDAGNVLKEMRAEATKAGLDVAAIGGPPVSVPAS
jgi:hypothetical protein